MDGERENFAQNSRRGFLRQLCSLPMIGGGVTLIGQPTASAVPVTQDLLLNYSTWLDMERRFLTWEMCGDDKSKFDGMHRTIWLDNDAARYHRDDVSPSTRAALVLSTVGCGWRSNT